MGNHEAYHSSFPSSKQRLAEFQNLCQVERVQDESLGEVVVLDQTRYDVTEDVTVLGCTLFSYVPPEQHEAVSYGLSEFYVFEDWTVDVHNSAHKSDIDWLTTQLSQIQEETPNK